MIRLNDSKVSNENLKRQLSEYDVIMKAMTLSVEPLVKRPSSLQNEKRLLERSPERLTRSYGNQKTVMERGVAKMIKYVATRFVRKSIYISAAIF